MSGRNAIARGCSPTRTALIATRTHRHAIVWAQCSPTRMQSHANGPNYHANASSRECIVTPGATLTENPIVWAQRSPTRMQSHANGPSYHANALSRECNVTPSATLTENPTVWAQCTPTRMQPHAKGSSRRANAGVDHPCVFSHDTHFRTNCKRRFRTVNVPNEL